MQAELDGGFDRWPVTFVLNARSPEEVIRSLTGAGRYDGLTVEEYLMKRGVTFTRRADESAFRNPIYQRVGCSLGKWCPSGNGKKCRNESHIFKRGPIDLDPIAWECEECGLTRNIAGKLKLTRKQLKGATRHICKRKGN